MKNFIVTGNWTIEAEIEAEDAVAAENVMERQVEGTLREKAKIAFNCIDMQDMATEEVED